MSCSEATAKLHSDPATNDGDVEFLKEQVQRLSAVLSQYQKKYRPPDGQNEPAVPLATSGPYASWLYNKKLLVPLLAEYDVTISDLNQQLSQHQGEVDSLAAKVEEITQENTRLHSELRKSLETQLQGTGGGVGSAAVDALQQQANIATKERDSYVELWKQCSGELEALQRSDREKSKALLKCRTELASAQKAMQTFDELQAACQELEKERAQCLRTAQQQERELEELQEGMGQCKAELRAAIAKNNQLRSSLDEITLQLKRRDTEKQRTENREDSMDERLHLLQLTNTDLEARLLAVQREHALLQGDRTDLEERLAAMQSKAASLEQREYEAIVHVKESMQLVEGALLEKEQGQIREQQLNGEVARLKTAMATIIHEAGARTKREVHSVREECNKSIDKMAEEIEKLEQECGQRRAHLEQAERENKALALALEQARAAIPLETARAGESLQALHARLCAAERGREEAGVKLEAANALAKRLKASLKEEQRAGQQLAEEELARRRRLQAENQDSKQQRITLMGQYDAVQQKLRESEKAREMTEQSFTKELAVLKHRQELKEKELRQRLSGCEEAHHKATQELRDMLTTQHRVGTKWREEAQGLADRLEQVESKLRGQVASHKRRAEELARELQQSRAKQDELSKRLAAMSSVQTVLQRELGEAESQVRTAVGQVNALLAREKELLQERRETHRQLDAIRFSVAAADPTASNHAHYGASDHAHRHAPYRAKTAASSQQPATTADTGAASNWNTALSELRHSIRQVREDIGFNGTTQPPMESSRAPSRRRRAKPSPPSPAVGEEEEQGSEHSALLHVDDLSHLMQS